MLFGLLQGYLFIYIVSAILPATVLMIYVYRLDRIEKEPVVLVGRLILMGVMAAMVSMLLEKVVEGLFPAFISETDPHYIIFFAFIAVAAVEESAKFVLLKKRTWREPNFNYMFDGIVYAAAVSMGFAAIENIGYLFSFGLSVAPLRALLAIPGHLSFAVFMGVFYGRARLWENRGDHKKSLLCLVISLFSAIFLHGFYDSCAMIGTKTANVVFIAFIVVMYISVFFILKRESAKDRPL